MIASSSDDPDGEKFFFIQADNKKETKEQTLRRKQQSRENAALGVANEELSSIETSMKEITKIDEDSAP